MKFLMKTVIVNFLSFFYSEYKLSVYLTYSMTFLTWLLQLEGHHTNDKLTGFKSRRLPMRNFHFDKMTHRRSPID